MKKYIKPEMGKSAIIETESLICTSPTPDITVGPDVDGEMGGDAKKIDFSDEETVW